MEKLQNLLFMTIKHPDTPEGETETQQSVRRAETFKGSLDNLVAKSMKCKFVFSKDRPFHMKLDVYYKL